MRARVVTFASTFVHAGAAYAAFVQFRAGLAGAVHAFLAVIDFALRHALAIGTARLIALPAIVHALAIQATLVRIVLAHDTLALLVTGFAFIKITLELWTLWVAIGGRAALRVGQALTAVSAGHPGAHQRRHHHTRGDQPSATTGHSHFVPLLDCRHVGHLVGRITGREKQCLW
jgi:hypothetical protein